MSYTLVDQMSNLSLIMEFEDIIREINTNDADPADKDKLELNSRKLELEDEITMRMSEGHSFTDSSKLDEEDDDDE